LTERPLQPRQIYRTAHSELNQSSNSNRPSIPFNTWSACNDDSSADLNTTLCYYAALSVGPH